MAERNQRTAATAGQEAEVPDTDKAAWQRMQQKATQEFIDRQSEQSLLVFVNGIAPAKRDLVIHERDETAIGDRYPVCVSAEIAKNLLGSAEGWFAIDDPAQGEELADETAKQFGLRQTSQ